MPLEDEKKYTLTLSDGTVLSDLTGDGCEFTTDKTIDASLFDYNLSPVTIDDGTDTRTIENATLINFVDDGLKAQFVISELSSMDLAIMQIQATQTYIAMMTGIDI